MERHGHTDASFAALVDAERSHINRIRRGEKQPGWGLVDAIKRVTNGQVTADDFMPQHEAAE